MSATNRQSNATELAREGVDEALDRRAHDAAALLSAVATVLRDTIERFGNVSGRVTETVLIQGDGADAELIVTLQDFDRLQQEFSALSDVFSHCVEAWTGPASGHAKLDDPIAAITLAELKERLSNRVHNERILMSPQPATRDDDVF